VESTGVIFTGLNVAWVCRCWVMSASFDAVIFDFDGVIVDTEWAIYQTWQELYVQHGAELSLDVYVQCVGSDHGAWDPKAYLDGLVGKSLDWDGILPAKHAEARKLLEAEGVMSGVIEWLDDLQGGGIPVGVASSSSVDWVGGWLEKLGLRERFVSLSCRDHVERIKPAPDLFLDAARKLGAAPARCLVVEDSFNGMVAAHAAGMRVLAVPNRITAGQDFSAALMRVESLGDFCFAEIMAS